MAVNDAGSAAREFQRLFPAVYLRFCRRGRSAPRVGPEAWAVLQHLAWSGPLTVTEAARHMQRAQSVMSEIFDALADKGLLSRMADARDRRRKLVWLTERGHALLEREREVLSLELLERGFEALSAGQRRGLVEGMRALSESQIRTAKKNNRRSKSDETEL